MPKAAQVDGVILQAATRDAVQRVYERDCTLIVERTHERSILFHIGRHLAAAMDNWPDSWQVDLEYNRVQGNGLKVVRKYMPATQGRSKGPVLPDLIVHDRARSTADSNLLVLEAKHAPTSADREFDYGKLRGFREVFKYRIAVFLEFRGLPCVREARSEFRWTRPKQDELWVPHGVRTADATSS